MAGAEVGTVVLNVGGRHFEVLRQTIEARPSTLLANLVDDIGSDAAKPFFVDANPERFAYILDWYRYGEIHLPTGFPVEAIINDARFFLLPDSVKINGSLHALPRPLEEELYHAAVSTIIKDWPTFDQYVADLIDDVRTDFEVASEEAKFYSWVSSVLWEGRTESFLEKCFTLSGFDSDGLCVWSDKTNICSAERLKVLVAELTKRGFECKVKGPTASCEAPVTLTVGLRLVYASKHREPMRVHLDGVAVANGAVHTQ